jgi:hypothetical protein
MHTVWSMALRHGHGHASLSSARVQAKLRRAPDRIGQGEHRDISD